MSSRKAYKAGYHVRGLPAQLGGTELGPLESHLVGEEFGWGNAGLAIALGVSSMPFLFAAMSGNPDLIRERRDARSPRTRKASTSVLAGDRAEPRLRHDLRHGRIRAAGDPHGLHGPQGRR